MGQLPLKIASFGPGPISKGAQSISASYMATFVVVRHLLVKDFCRYKSMEKLFIKMEFIN